jgi:hypothetical protein
MGRHASKVSRIEHGSAVPSVADIRAWCAYCDAQDHVDDLIASLRAVETAYIEWRRLEVTGLRHLQVSSMPLHERTKLFRVYHSLVVPGQLQTPGYATALLTDIATFRELPDDVEQAVTARMERQRVLSLGDRRCAVVLEEAVLRYRIGSVDVMAAQLAHLITAATLPSMSLGIIPFATPDRHIWAVEGFSIFDDEQVEVELLSARVTVTQPAELAVYTKAFAALSAQAVYGAAARALLTSAIGALDSEP